MDETIEANTNAPSFIFYDTAVLWVSESEQRDQSLIEQFVDYLIRLRHAIANRQGFIAEIDAMPAGSEFLIVDSIPETTIKLGMVSNRNDRGLVTRIDLIDIYPPLSECFPPS